MRAGVAAERSTNTEQPQRQALSFFFSWSLNAFSKPLITSDSNGDDASHDASRDDPSRSRHKIGGLRRSDGSGHNAPKG